MAWVIVGLLVLILVVLVFIWNEVSKVCGGLMMLRDSFIVLTQEQTSKVGDLAYKIDKELDRQSTERHRF